MRIAIIGAGLAGLTAAYELRESGHQVDVYEATDRLGGKPVSYTHLPLPTKRIV